MPKETVLRGYGLAVVDEEIPDIDPKDGQLRHDALGRAKTVMVKKLVFIEPNGLETIQVLLPEEARLHVIRELTGGIDIASELPADLVKH